MYLSSSSPWPQWSQVGAGHMLFVHYVVVMVMVMVMVIVMVMVMVTVMVTVVVAVLPWGPCT
jgi:hypothetical protein